MSPERLAHAERILATEIEYVGNPEFKEPSLGGKDPIVAESLRMLETLNANTDVDPLSGSTHHQFRSLTESQILDPAQETALFRQMNYLKFQASRLQARVDRERIHAKLIDRIDRMLTAALAIRNHIVQSNMRLVVSIVKKFTSAQHTLDDLLSQETLTLMKAAEKFDFSRGFRFSTYAYRSIIRSAYRSVSNARNEGIQFVGEASDWTFEQEDDRSSALKDQMWDNLRATTSSLVRRLDRRERFIVRSRYALGSHRQVRTFQFLSDKLGISKERARQIEKRAVEKLRSMSAELNIDELTGVTIN